MNTKTNLIGRRYGKLVVISEAPPYEYPSGYTEVVWLCKCDCGKEKEIRAKSLVKKDSQSCGCSQSNAIKFFGDEASFRSLYQEYSGNARKRNLIFSLLLEEFHKLTSANCYYCGVAPSTKGRARRGTKIPYIYNGIDRVDNKIGYVSDNCVPCCCICNLMKKSLSKEEFIKHIARIYNHTKDYISS